MAKNIRIKTIIYCLFPRLVPFINKKDCTFKTIRNVDCYYLGFLNNIGDNLGPVIIEHLLSKKDITFQKKKKTKLMSIGSVISFGNFHCVVWGSGLLNTHFCMRMCNQRLFRKYDFRAVRGPLTRNALMFSGGYNNVPKVYGDPALIMKDIYNPKCSKKYDVSIILHISDTTKIFNVHTIDVRTSDYKFFIDEIVKSKKIVSSSLHGIILAELYGVPCFLLHTKEDGDLFKYYDYFFSTNRYNVKIAKSIEEALCMSPMDLPTNLDKMKDDLIASFPYDLFFN